ncbi:DUF948 domain-containing protein [Granulicatella sp. zg-ZJ]|uniref:DUF948 domain-containing protein n=1 Tax=unclassified Granulicatella TaxID=2630493 RepID=UPI0013BF7030|nr:MULTISPECIES: DUF948 domain-containing protein [unclassified Granulicatella]MBS4751074.1 DUF948 domain-containing protein [Carnobacteriaceae bacterium zg-ZUI78]NEW62798.1 DUF948 domain-containing protein [Granulicatella sp. zg-ZJ]NEW65422.1 DUF948 domain-containing protein [Granulicatella sp. zg-84]QMI85218.1 DUF948 domain-containing protein [Carnobacteriaceae bacterium zg-84]
MGFNNILLSLLLVACIVLVIVLVLFIQRLMGVVKTTNQLLNEVKNSLDIVTKDVDSLSIEVEGLLNKANYLVNDINGKLEQTDPVFKALGELGVSVSNVNTSANNLSKSFVLRKKQASKSVVKMGSAVSKIFKSTTKKKPTTIKKF